MVQPPLEQGRRDPVVLRGTEHDDLVGPVCICCAVVVGRAPHDECRAANEDDRDGAEDEQDRPDGVPAEPGHPSMLGGGAKRRPLPDAQVNLSTGS